MITHDGSSIVLGPSLAHAAGRVFDALVDGTNPMAVLDAELADPTAQHSVAVVGMAPAATSFVVRGEELQLRIETPSGTVESFPELRRGWRGGAVTSMSGWRIRIKSTTEASLLGDRTDFILADGAAPCGEAWFGEVDEFSFVDAKVATTFTGAIPVQDSQQPPALGASAGIDSEPLEDDTIPDAQAREVATQLPGGPVTNGAVQAQVPANPTSQVHPAAPVPPQTSAAAPHPQGHAMPQQPAPIQQQAWQQHAPQQGTPAPQQQFTTSQASPQHQQYFPAEPHPPVQQQQQSTPRHAMPAREWAPQLNSNQGHVLTLSSTVVAGRDPQVDRAPDPNHAQLMQLRSPQQEISRSHLVVTYEGGNVLVWDLGSANGTVVARGGTIPEPLQPMSAVTLSRGDVVDLGDGAMLWLG